MATIIMDGRDAAGASDARARAACARSLGNAIACVPALAAILVGDDPASRQYVRNKRRFAERTRLRRRIIKITDADATTERHARSY